MIEVFKYKRDSQKEGKERKANLQITSFDNAASIVARISQLESVQPNDIYIWFVRKATSLDVDNFLGVMFHDQKIIIEDAFSVAVCDYFSNVPKINYTNGYVTYFIARKCLLEEKNDLQVNIASKNVNDLPKKPICKVSNTSSIFEYSPVESIEIDNIEEVNYILKEDFNGTDFENYFKNDPYTNVPEIKEIALYDDVETYSNEKLLENEYVKFYGSGRITFKYSAFEMTNLTLKDKQDRIQDLFYSLSPSKRFPIIYLFPENVFQADIASYQKFRKATVENIDNDVKMTSDEYTRKDNRACLVLYGKDFRIRVDHTSLFEIQPIFSKTTKNIQLKTLQASIAEVFIMLSEHDNKHAIFREDHLLGSPRIELGNLRLGFNLSRVRIKNLDALLEVLRNDSFKQIFHDVKINIVSGINRLQCLYKSVNTTSKTEVIFEQPNKIMIDNFSSVSDIKNIQKLFLFAINKAEDTQAQDNKESDSGSEKTEDEKKDVDTSEEYSEDVFFFGGGKVNEPKNILLKKLKELDKDLFDWTVKATNKSKSGKLKTSDTYARKCTLYPLGLTEDQFNNKEIIDSEYQGAYDKEQEWYVSVKDKDGNKNNYYICPRYWCPYDKKQVVLDKNDLCEDGKAPFLLNNEQIVSPYLKNDKSPDNRQLPCCRQVQTSTTLDKDLKVTFRDLDRTILSIVDDTQSQPKCGISCHKKLCSESEEDSFALCLNDGSSAADLRKKIKDNLTMHEYIRLKNGYNVKAFFDSSRNLTDSNELKAFVHWIKNDSDDYMKHLSLEKSIFINEMKDNIYNAQTLREYIIWNSYTNFLKFIESDIELLYEDLASFLSFNWFSNSNRLVLFVEVKGTNSLRMHVPFQFSILNEQNEYSCMVRDNDCIGAIVVKESKTVQSKYTTLLKMNANIIDSLQKVTTQNKMQQNEGYERVFKEEKVMKCVIDSNFRCCGVILESNLFIPFIGYQLNIPENIELLYLDRVNEFKTTLTLEEMKELYAKYNVKFTIPEEQNRLLFTDLGNFQYLKHDEINEFSLKSLASIAQSDYHNTFIDRLFELSNSKDFEEILYYLRHDLNPMSDEMKLNLLKLKFKVDDQELVEAVYRLSPQFIKKLKSESHSARKNYFSYNKIEGENKEGTLLKLYDSQFNPFKMFNSSYEDSEFLSKCHIDLELSMSGGGSVTPQSNICEIFESMKNKLAFDLTYDGFKRLRKRCIIRAFDSDDFDTIKIITEGEKLNLVETLKHYANRFRDMTDFEKSILDIDIKK